MLPKNPSLLEDLNKQIARTPDHLSGTFVCVDF